MQSVTINNNQAGQRLDKFLRKYLPNAGNGFLYKMLRKKNITLNGKKAEGSEMLSAGDTVTCFFSQETFEKFSGSGFRIDETPHVSSYDKNLHRYEKAYQTLRGIQVLYEDNNLIFLNKPAGVLSQKAGPEDISLNEWLVGYLLQESPSLKRELATFHPSVCNRLDRNTSGIVLCGKSLSGLQFLSGCIRERRVRKFYRTICIGELKEPARIKGYLSKDSARNTVTVFEKAAGEAGVSHTSSPSRRQDYIETYYRPLQTQNGYTYLEVELITGKPHQIRAHLAYIGHPLIGDYKYGDTGVNHRLKQKYGLSAQLLHAHQVTFPPIAEGPGLPVSEQIFTVPEPEAFVLLKNSLVY